MLIKALLLPTLSRTVINDHAFVYLATLTSSAERSSIACKIGITAVDRTIWAVGRTTWAADWTTSAVGRPNWAADRTAFEQVPYHRPSDANCRLTTHDRQKTENWAYTISYGTLVLYFVDLFGICWVLFIEYMSAYGVRCTGRHIKYISAYIHSVFMKTFWASAVLFVLDLARSMSC